MRRVITLIALSVCVTVAAVAAAQRPATSSPASPTVEVYKDPTCGCCALWVEHLRKDGFTVKTTDTADMTTFKTTHGVPRKAQSCHTAIVDGYVLEGHVPVADVRRLLKERPTVAGLAVPGMPIGSPGMEVNGMKPHAYDVLAFDKQGATTVFASYNK